MKPLQPVSPSARIALGVTFFVLFFAVWAAVTLRLPLAVYPSRIHTTLPSIIAGYGSPSIFNHGATLATRSRGVRLKMIFESALIKLDNKMRCS